jgi:hypothetical protein
MPITFPPTCCSAASGLALSDRTPEEAGGRSLRAADRREIKANTLWPKPRVFHIPLTGDNLAQFRNRAGNHAEPEAADHLVVYRGEDVLLWAHDAGHGYVSVGA